MTWTLGDGSEAVLCSVGSSLIAETKKATWNNNKCCSSLLFPEHVKLRIGHKMALLWTVSPPILLAEMMWDPTRRSNGPAVQEGLRYVLLCRDPFIVRGTVKPNSVVCAGCRQKIRLDRRNGYYPGFWVRHKHHCVGVQNLKGGPVDVSMAQINIASRQASLMDID